MQSLKQKLLKSLAASDPISVAQYMHLCHSHPEYGYYATGNPLGKDGDFITAPEISQMFGELIAIWAISVWKAMNCPNPFQIGELGPGRGTLMKDFIRTAQHHRDFVNATKFKLIETSASLIQQQRQALAKHVDLVEWHKTIDDLKPLPTLFIANEFLDAIAFRQFVKTGEAWLERCVGIDKNNQLAFVLGNTQIDRQMLPADHTIQPIGAIYETAPARQAIVISIANHLASHGGAALFIDYGHEKSGFGDTFQAVKSHEYVSPLAYPGLGDLTSHVDFQAIGEAASQQGAKIGGILTQGEFLLQLGLLQRAGRLGHCKPVEFQQQIQTDVERLAAPEQMGKLFKVFCLAQENLVLPLFENQDSNQKQS